MQSYPLIITIEWEVLSLGWDKLACINLSQPSDNKRNTSKGIKKGKEILSYKFAKVGQNLRENVKFVMFEEWS